MIDENLPTFYLNPSADSVKHNATVYLAQYGSDAAPAYTIRHADPASPDSKNRYAAALYDSYCPDVLFGEVLLIPEWTQPTLSQEEINRNGGIPPPPQPILPHEFAIQLYNPDQQVVMKHRPGTWNSAAHWEFEMPMETFRQPSTSTLDRSQSDPSISDATPKINFKWKKDGKFAKDLICNLSGKSTNPDGSKRRNKEPDIPIAFFRSLKQVTIYEPNLSRVDMEDPKGLEVVLLLSAAVIRDVYFAPLKDAFNISEAPRRDSAARRDSGVITQRKSSTSVTNGVGVVNDRIPASQKLPAEKPARHPSAASDGLPLRVQPQTNPRPPPTDPRTQWEIDAETQRLKKQVEYEERARKKAEKEETKRIKAMLEAEEKEARRKQAEIDKETERLKKIYLDEQRKVDKQAQQAHKPRLPPRHSAPASQPPYQQPQQQYQQPYQQEYGQPPQFYRPQGYVGAYLAAPNQPERPSSAQGYNNGPVLKPKRSSFFGLGGSRSNSDGGRKRSF